jgi:DNA-directed RNA polymerase subunit beta
LQVSKVFARKNQEFIQTEEKRINFVSTAPNQIISIGTGLIPFLEHNDANRALMGSNMQRQAIPLIKKEKPIVQTGLEKRVAKDSQSSISAKRSGVIKYVTKKKIIIHEIFSALTKPTTSITLLRKIKNKLKEKKDKKFKTKKKVKYELQQIKKSNQNTIISQNPTIKKDQWVKKGELIADGTGTNKGKLSLGKNLLIGYIGWEGYNFEDAVVINEKLIHEDTLTSISIKKFKTFLVNNEIGEVRTKYYLLNLETIKVKKHLEYLNNF